MVTLFWQSLPGHYAISLLIFAIACLTDSLDGAVARRQKSISPFGIFFDPIADKILIGGAFICLVGLGIFQAWAVVLLLAREFAVTGLRIVAADQKVILVAETGGKLKTFFHAFTVNYILARLVLTDEFGLIKTPLSKMEINVLLAICLALSLYTGWVYFVKNAKLLNP